MYTKKFFMSSLTVSLHNIYFIYVCIYVGPVTRISEISFIIIIMNIHKYYTYKYIRIYIFTSRYPTTNTTKHAKSRTHKHTHTHTRRHT